MFRLYWTFLIVYLERSLSNVAKFINENEINSWFMFKEKFLKALMKQFDRKIREQYFKMYNRVV